MSKLTIGKLAKACEVNIDTVRYYDRKELLVPLERTGSGYRVYSSDSIKRLRFIRKAQSLGFTLEEIKEMLDMHQMPGVDCADIKARAEQKITQIQKRIKDLQTMETGLKKLASHCGGKGTRLKDCSIIEYLYGDES